MTAAFAVLEPLAWAPEGPAVEIHGNGAWVGQPHQAITGDDFARPPRSLKWSCQNQTHEYTPKCRTLRIRQRDLPIMLASDAQ